MSASLPFLALTFPEIDPVLIQIGPFALRWYALAYIAGLLLALFYCRRMLRYASDKIAPEFFDDLLLWATLGVVLGGRLGYVLFYNPLYFLQSPLQILKVWEGGMSFHGGLVGVALAIIFFSRHRKLRILAVGDIVAAAAPIGLFLGRLANFINGELFGRVTDSPLGMVFPNGGELPRHPSQLYEAALEGLLLFMVLYVLIRLGALRYRGLVFGLFLVGYGLSRFTVEFFREPDAHLGFLFQFITMGQLLSLPMILLGAYLAWQGWRSPAPLPAKDEPASDSKTTVNRDGRAGSASR